MRKLSPTFLADLQHGELRPLLERVHADDTLDLHIREATVSVYYRGMRLAKVDEVRVGAYSFTFDLSYFADVPPPRGFNAKHAISDSTTCAKWLEHVPTLKDTMDRWLTTKKTQRERESQQLLVRENTRDASVATGTDYFVIDIEYAREDARADAVAVHWTSTPAARKRRTDHRLALIEIKYGDTALTGSAGLAKHVTDAERLASHPQNLRAFQDEMLELFGQKHELGLLRIEHALESFDAAQDPPLELIFAIANHDPASKVLRRTLAELPPAPHVEILVASASDFGYGLYRERMFSLSEYLQRPS